MQPLHSCLALIIISTANWTRDTDSIVLSHYSINFWSRLRWAVKRLMNTTTEASKCMNVHRFCAWVTGDGARKPLQRDRKTWRCAMSNTNGTQCGWIEWPVYLRYATRRDILFTKNKSQSTWMGKSIIILTYMWHELFVVSLASADIDAAYS